MSTKPHESGKMQKRRKAKQKPVLERVPQAQQSSDDGNSKFARALGSTDYATRDKGVQALSRFLLYKDELPELDVMKLWKGLFFCFWHSDKVPVQTELAERLAGLLPQMQPRMAQLYWAGLLATLRREWFAMDHHRIDKFLMLVRKFVAAVLTRMQAANWDPAGITSLTLQLPLGQTLLPATPHKSLGLSYHIADIWLQELQKLAAASDQSVPHDSLLQLLEPFVLVLESSGEQALVTRVKVSVFDVLSSDTAAAAAAAAKGSSESDEDDDSNAHLIYCQQLHAEQLAAQLFERGAAEGVKSRNRQLLYSISKELEKAAGNGRKRTAAARDKEQQQEFKQKKHKTQQLDQQHGQDEMQGQDDQQQQQQQEKAVVQLEQQQQQQQQQEEQQEVPSTKKKKKKHQSAEQAQIHDQQDQQQQAQPVAANGITPLSKKEGRLQQQQQQQLNAVVAGDSPAVAAAAAAAAAVTPQADSARKSSKKKIKQSTDAVAATPRNGSAAAAAAAGAGPYSSAAKRGVRINLKKNVYFAHGAPVPPEDIRTPPTAKPKGSALKASSKVAAATAPATQLGSRLDAVAPPANGKRKPVTPSSVPRVKAAAFF